jgi:hypothetical protein
VTSKYVTVKSTMFLHHNMHKITWLSPDGETTIKFTTVW